MGLNRLRQLRINAGLSIAEFSKRSGVSVGHIYRIELGAAGRLRLSTIEKIAKALEVDEDKVFPEPSAKPRAVFAPSGLKWRVILTCPKCQARFRLLVEEGMPEPGQGEVSCPVCGFIQSISLRRAS